MEIEILEFTEGAKNARGLTVIIDVFRAFSLACYAFGEGASRIIPVGEPEEALVNGFSIRQILTTLPLPISFCVPI